MRLRRFLISDPMARRTLLGFDCPTFGGPPVPWRLDHVQLAIPAGSEELCDEFYVGLLGFTTLEKPPILAARGGRWYQRDEAVVHLGVEEEFLPAKKAHPALVIDFYEGTVERLKSAGVEVRPDESNPGVRRCHVDDPVGNRLELIDSGMVAYAPLSNWP
jgi:catechol 2,3-dioxygenase-like lactoylglutathione lyase family enzyme